MTIFTRLTAALCALFLSLAPASAHDGKQMTKVGDLVIHQPWSRATPRSAKVGAGYLKIENKGDTADRLVSVSSPIAGVTQIHAMSITDGVMKMRELKDGVNIPAGGSVMLKPGGNHIMFMKLGAPIRKGEAFEATLTFEKAGTATVTFMPVKIGGTPKGMKRGSH